MKGIFFTAITFLIFFSIILYVSIVNSANVERSSRISEKISAERIYYSWNNVRDHLFTVLGINVTEDHQANSTQINETLPAGIDVKNFLGLYQEFINRTYRDKAFDIHFENPGGQPIDLSTLDPKTFFNILPMGVNYSYCGGGPGTPCQFGQNELFIYADDTNFSYVKNVTVYLKLLNDTLNCKPITGVPQDCEKWTGGTPSPTPNCSPHCLNLTMSIEGNDSKIYNFTEHYFDLDRPSGYADNVKLGTSAAGIDISVGPLPVVLNIKLHNTEADSSVTITFNSTDFYVNIATILNVTSDFGRKVSGL